MHGFKHFFSNEKLKRRGKNGSSAYQIHQMTRAWSSWIYVATSGGSENFFIYVEPDTHWTRAASYEEAKTDWQVAMNHF